MSTEFIRKELHTCCSLCLLPLERHGERTILAGSLALVRPHRLEPHLRQGIRDLHTLMNRVLVIHN